MPQESGVRPVKYRDRFQNKKIKNNLEIVVDFWKLVWYYICRASQKGAETDLDN